MTTPYSYIYLIYCDISGKIYVGKTGKGIDKRFAEHIHTISKEEHRPLYAAMQKYGVEHFHVLEIEKIPTDEASAAEEFWIEYFNAYTYGYNATTGGDGRSRIDYGQVIEAYERLQEIGAVANELNINATSVRHILRAANIQTRTAAEINNQKYGRKVDMFSLDDKHLKQFGSIREACRYLSILNNKDLSGRGYQQKIKLVCDGERKTSMGYKWKWAAA